MFRNVGVGGSFRLCWRKLGKLAEVLRILNKLLADK